MKSARAKELKYKILAEITGSAVISDEKRKEILNSPKFKNVFRRAKKQYEKK